MALCQWRLKARYIYNLPFHLQRRAFHYNERVLCTYRHCLNGTLTTATI